MRRPWLSFVVVLVVSVIADQGSKAWARGLRTDPPACAMAELADGRCHAVPTPVIAGYWDWELAANPGAAFSSFVGGVGARVALSAIAIAALVGIGALARRTPPEARLRRAALALVAGGALGNLIDRVHDGVVTDFVRWRVHDHLWPVFNVADAALVIGVLLLLFARAPKPAARAPAAAVA